MLVPLLFLRLIQSGESVLAPGIPEEFQQQILKSAVAGASQNPDWRHWSMNLSQFKAKQDSLTDLIPKSFIDFANEYCETVFGEVPKTDWKGYRNSKGYAWQEQFFGMATIYNSIRQGDRQVLIYCNPAALTCIVSGGVDTSDSREIRTEKLLRILSKSTTFVFDENKVELDRIPALGDNILGPLWVRGIRFYQKGRANNGLKPLTWWAMFLCFTNKDVTIFEFPYFNRALMASRDLSRADSPLRKAGTGLTPLDEEYWKADF